MKMMKRIKRPIMWLALLAAGFMLVFLDTAERQLDIPRHSTVEGEVCGVVKDIEYKNDKVYLYLKNVNFISDELKDFKEIKSSSLLCAKLGAVCSFDADYDKISDCGVNIGSTVKIRGKINVYNKASNPGEFDMRRFYISKGYLFSAYSCELLSGDSHKNIIADTSYRISARIGGLIDRSLNPKDAGMMKAILLADKTDLDKETKDLYKDAGAGHLLAISGLHISMFAAITLFLLKKTPLSFKASYIITVFILFLYGYLIGFSASALRATVMFAILCIGKMFNKSYDSLNSMAVALLVTIMIKPLYVLQNGFLYMVSYDRTKVYKINIENPADVKEIPLGFTTNYSCSNDYYNSGNLYIANIGDWVVGSDFLINTEDRVFRKANNAPWTYTGSPLFQYGPYLFSLGGYDAKHTRQNLFLLTPYLATINNLETSVIKTADKTMKITYTIQEE